MGAKPINFSTPGCMSGSYKSMDRLNRSGSISLDHYNLGELTTSGTALLTDSDIRVVQASGCLCASGCKLGNVRSSGSTSFSSCQFSKNLTVTGALELLDSRVEGNMVCAGEAKISHSTIQHSLEFSGNRLEVLDSFIDEIIVKSRPSSYSWNFQFFGFGFSSREENPPKVITQKVILSGPNCHIKTICFEAKKPGIVILKDGAPAPCVINGRIEKGDFSS